MARKSRKILNHAEPEILKVSVPKSIAGIYARLSVEDNGCSSNDSIQNQITYLEEYVKRNEEDLQFAQLYVDNGRTGTNFDRKGWVRMMDDVRAGRINCVVVKDFSRIGRNYIEVGNYLEKIFPFLGVRVISVNESFDSRRQPFESNMLMNSLTNIVNEYYARDISRKVLQAKRTMQKNGEYASGVYPYGYRRSDTDRRKMDVDLEAAVVVKKIFQWRVCGKGCTWIANCLNQLAIPSPGLYRFMNGKQSFRSSGNSKWMAEHVSGILANPVYLGHMVQGKTRSSHFRDDGRAKRIPKEDWIIAEGTHDPLVTQADFDVVVRMAEESRRKYNERMDANAGIPQAENPLRSKVFCGQCGRMMFRRSRVKSGSRKYLYYCDAKRRTLDAKCARAYIHEIPLMNAVKEITKLQLHALGALQVQRGGRVKDGDTLGGRGSGEERKRELEREILLIKKKRRELYEDMKEGMLVQEDFEYERGRLAERQLQCESGLRNMEEGGGAGEDIIETIKGYRGDIFECKGEDIPVELLDKLIEKIIVLSPERIDITYVYTDVFEKWRGEMQAQPVNVKEGGDVG